MRLVDQQSQHQADLSILAPEKTDERETTVRDNWSDAGISDD